MNQRAQLFSALFLVGSALAFTAGGCELIASADRSKIPGGTGGAEPLGGGGTGPTTSSTTTTVTTSTATASGGGGSSTTTTGGGGIGGGTGGGCQGPADCPPPGNDCDVATCSPGGVCGTAHATSGTACTDGGNKVCDGMGTCVACVAASDCPASNSPCQDAACKADNTCGFTDHMQGSTCGTGLMCDNMGNCVGCTMAGQCQQPTTACQSAQCNGGMCSFANNTQGTSCTDSGGRVCDANGVCQECNSTPDCPGTGTLCKTVACNANQCQTADASSMTACTDNGGVICDGSGNCVECNAPGDCTPPTEQCLKATCSGANVCGTTPVTDGNTCNESGGAVCLSGGCVACIQASDCPATGTTCKTRNCTAGNACVPQNASDGTVCSDNGGTTCMGGVCVVGNTCDDGVKDGDETDVDCGGSCPACTHAKDKCSNNNDCSLADGLTCLPYTAGDFCVLLACSSTGEANATDADGTKSCGGADCGPCPATKMCNINSDCSPGPCTLNICQ